MVTVLKDTRIGCLRDLAQYWIAMEDYHIRDREISLQPSPSNIHLGHFSLVTVDEEEIGGPNVLPYARLILVLLPDA